MTRVLEDFHGRFMDDVLMVSSHETSEILQAANSWHPNIVLEVTVDGQTVDYLDVTIQLQDGVVSWWLYEKPQAHLAASSEHPPGTFKCVVHGCFTRLRRRHHESQQHKMREAEQRLILRLYRRGYSTWHVQRARAARVRQRCCKRGVSLRLPWQKTLVHQVSRVRALIRRVGAFSRASAIGVDTQARITHSISRCNFLRDYGRNWLSGWDRREKGFFTAPPQPSSRMGCP